MKLKASASIQIQKPVEEVYEGIVNPDAMTKYFISESNGRLDSGEDLLWKFPEFPDRYPITSTKVEANRTVSFVWDPETVVTIALEALPGRSTVVRVKESGKELNEANLKWVIENSGGWSNFLACLKAYLEYGIQLRKGAYDFMCVK
ncbi:SRPBCC domain-containing protein [Cryomorphaceae bacterium 1068]|nr:SRPBCC domain-containing protein [Cryomorphaceae bacterium 1068]